MKKFPKSWSDSGKVKASGMSAVGRLIRFVVAAELVAFGGGFYVWWRLSREEGKNHCF